jgi:diguanylate cyclase (GGDEF)-like protein
MPVFEVMDPRLADLLARWRTVGGAGDPLVMAPGHADNLLVIDAEGAKNRYSHYGRAFVEHFGADLANQVIDMVPAEILPSDRRGMLEFEYHFARRAQKPLWRSYTAEFSGGRQQTWQRLVLPAGGERLIVGAYLAGDARSELSPAAALLRLVIERVPVVLDAEGRIADLALSLQAFSDTRRHVAELEVLATRDPLTGMFNSRHFRHLAGLELEHARLMGRWLSLAVLDIDHFKRINDTHGHPTGDAALVGFAEACKVALREYDVIGRLGGEEFAVVLPNTGSEGAVTIASRLRRQVEQLRVPLPGQEPLRFTVSIGVVSVGPGETTSVPVLLERADKALYKSKEGGRNRVTVG